MSSCGRFLPTAPPPVTEIRTFIPKPPVMKDYYVETPYSVRLDGTYYNCLNFFDRLAHEQRIMSVSGLSLGTPEGGGMGSYKVAPDGDGRRELHAHHLLQQTLGRGRASQEEEITARMGICRNTGFNRCGVFTQSGS